MTLQRLLKILYGRIWIIVLTVVLAAVASVVIWLGKPQMYNAAATLVIDFKTPLNSNALLPPVLQEDYMATQIAILRSKKVAFKVIDKLGLGNDENLRVSFAQDLGAEGTFSEGSFREWLADGLLSGLRVYTQKSTRLVNVGYAASDPEWAANVANAFAESYIRANLELDIEPAKKRADWIDDQLVEFRGKLEDAHARLASYQQQTGILGTEDRLNIEMGHLTALTGQLADAQAQAQNIENRVRQLEQLKANDPRLETIPEVLTNSYLQILKADLRRKETELADISSQVGKRHPRYLSIAAEIGSLRAKLRTEIGAVIEGVKDQVTLTKGREESLREAQAIQKEKLLELRTSGDDLPALVREVESAQRTYDEALERYQQYTMQSRENVTNVTILNSAVKPSSPSWPSPTQNLAIAMFLGLVFGCVLAFLLELRDRRVRSADDVVTITALPLLETLEQS